MALNFPNSPTLNQIYTAGNRSWQWNGRFWQSISVTVGYTGSQGFVGSAGIDGIIGVDGYTGSQGATGTSVRIVGSLADQSLLPDPYGGEIGDGYLLASTGHLWLWAGTAWNDIGQLSGDVGPTGFVGSAGFTGSVGFVGSQGESSFTWGPTAPQNPAVGDRWYDTSELILLVYLDDGDSLQWVEVSATGFLGQTGFTGSAGLSGVLVQTVTYVGQATAADTQGGETLGLSGAGFQSGITVYVGSTACAATLVDSSNLTFVSPAKGAGVYDIVVYNTNGSSGTRPRGIEYSGAPVWVTSATLPEQTTDSAISIILSATSNSAVTYFLQQGSSMPAGLSLSSAGVITGTVTGLAEDTTYSFTVVTIDAESQTTPRSFSLVVKNIITASYLVMAGGGSGGHAHAGGGGAGGYRESSTVINLDTNYTVTIGAGATPGAINRGRGNSGSNSVFGSISATGGGGGGSQVGASEGIAGGSGGGGGNATSGSKAGGQGNTGGYSPVEGYPGGSASAGSAWVSAGGGGAAEAGFPSSGSTPGNGGSGRSSSITGTLIFRAGGGGGCGEGDGTGGVGGAGGGTNGSGGTSGSISAAANSGSGSGGTRDAPGTNLTPSGAGGSGVVIIKYPDNLTITNSGGGLTFITSTSVSGFKVTTFTAGTGNIVFYRNSDVIEMEYLVVAGGGGGGSRYGAGGGAGGYRTDTGVNVIRTTAYTVTVGAGGSGGSISDYNAGSNGSDSIFSSITSTGGGRGGAGGVAGGNGGSGGGSGTFGNSPGAGNGNTPSVSPSQGNNGGLAHPTGAVNYGVGGGGGASAVGGNGVLGAGGIGGAGANSAITGANVTYAGGGGGGGYRVTNAGGAGGLGGGGNAGVTSNSNGSPGTPNRGGGGGGASWNENLGNTNSAGGTGGSGVVIIAYPDSHAAPTAISGGLVYDQPTRAGYRVYRFTQGTGNITF